MLVFPAIDIKGGRVVRLFEGDRQREVVYAADPVDQAEQFVRDGATWVHVVDMDRAFQTGGDNTSVVRLIGKVRGVRMQVGGLLRSERDAGIAFDAGAERAVVSTAAALEPGALSSLVRRFGAERLAVAIDTRGGCPVRRGSAEPVTQSAADIATGAQACGIRTVLYRDLERDGMLAGFDVTAAAALRAEGREVIVSGGGSALHDLAAARAAGLDGAIIGRALYEGCFTLREAIACSG
jgi:phosphoribosylformimino-5-aminoimidazole carboxamide ribotide isomerase